MNASVKEYVKSKNIMKQNSQAIGDSKKITNLKRNQG